MHSSNSKLSQSNKFCNNLQAEMSPIKEIESTESAEKIANWVAWYPIEISNAFLLRDFSANIPMLAMMKLSKERQRTEGIALLVEEPADKRKKYTLENKSNKNA